MGNPAAPGGAGTSNAPVGAGRGGAQNTGITPGATAGAAGEGNTNVTPITPGAGGSGNTGANGGSGNAGTNGGAQGNVDPPGGDGGFVSLDVNGGPSAAFVCPEGVTFGNPLTGMGAVTSVAAPQGSFFAFIEGPVWVGSVNKLFFSDNASGPERIWQISPPFTTPSIFMPDSGSNGLAIDNDDQLLLADQSDNRITRVTNTAPATVSGTLLPTGAPRPNDLIMRSDDNVYFTDPDTGGRGLYRLSPTGQLSGPFIQANTMNAPGAPNGVVLSPDENTLYVGDVQQNFVASFELLEDGSIDTASGQRFTETRGNTVDGMAVDCAGNLYVGVNNGVEVYAPDKTFIGTVPVGEASNATFGGADRRTLFVTSRSVLKFVTLAVPGLPD